MKKKEANKLLDFLNGDRTIQNFIAQAKSRYILYNVEEEEENFPSYVKNLSDRNNYTAFSYLTIGCYLAEGGKISKATQPLHNGANLLEYSHKYKAGRMIHSKYYLLTSSLAYYASYEYSKAFVVLNEAEYDTVAGRLFSLFLKKKFEKLLLVLNEVLLNNAYSPVVINAEKYPSDEMDSRIYNYLLAKSIANVLEYFYSGNEKYLDESTDILNDLLELLEIDKEPSMWWCVRLFRIIINGLNTSAVWKVLPPLFSAEQSCEVSNFIKSLSLRTPVPIVELFVSQRDAISKALKPGGLVVCLPTSGGKTRIAEISIFKSLLDETDSIVLYIAPFRSLAYEVEQTLESTFRQLGIGVSHLYGGGQYSKIDKLRIDKSRIIIATPEKAKALIRADDDIAKKIKLVVIDEGHLLGNEDRLIRNEMFFEELRHHIEENKGKFVLLSAVLPNAGDIAKWVTGNKKNVYSNSWQPSSKRLGVLEFTGKNVNINWLNEQPDTWNYKFITPIEDGQSRIIFPKTKREAIAASAIKLSVNGSVLIFHAKSNIIMAQARDCLVAMGGTPEIHTWTDANTWQIFQLTVEQSLGKDCELLKFAKYGILCHYSKLPNNVKLCLERLMRKANPKIIISTTTLAQGVNLGVSTVIIADIWFAAPGGDRVSINKFWNIVGRAGRAFVDSEGKVLFAVDVGRSSYRNERERQTAEEYLLNRNQDNATSGILQMLSILENISTQYNIDFELLLELISENYDDENTLINKEEFERLQNKMDLIDETLLALNEHKKSYLDVDPSKWIDSFFRNSLAFIQAKNSSNYNENAVIDYLKKRNKTILQKVGDRKNWKALINQGIPLRASMKLKKLLPSFEQLYTEFQSSDKSLDSLIGVLTKLENLIHSFPGVDFKRKDKIGNSKIKKSDRLTIKRLWLNGIPYYEIEKKLKKQKTNYFCNDYYGFTIPWVLNAIAKSFVVSENLAISEFYQNLAIKVETGVKSLLAAKIYLAGIRCRKVAIEISLLLDNIVEELNLKELLKYILENRESYFNNLSEDAKAWLNMLQEDTQKESTVKIKFSPFSLDQEIRAKKLYSRTFDGKIYLISPDYSEKIEVASTSSHPYYLVVNKPNICFIFNKEEKLWVINII